MIRSIYNNKLDSETKSPAKALTFAYLIAFAIIGLFSVGIHLSTNLLMEQLTETSEVTYHLSRTRTLIQRLPYQVESFAEHESDVDQSRLRDSLLKIQASVQIIRGKIQPAETINVELTDVFYGKVFELNKKMNAYTNAATHCAILDMQYDEARVICTNVKRHMDQLEGREIIAGLDVALDKYRQATLDKIDFYHSLQIGGIVVILLVLVLEALLIFRPLINRIHNYHKMLVEQALQDPLTGLKNRRAFINQATAELSQARRDKTPVAMALMDLDKFKSINDTYGHDVGDAVITHFANQLKMRVRRGDIIGRIGGEEFAIMLVRSTDDEDAYSVINRIREAVAESPCSYIDKAGKAKELSYTVSVGIYSCTPDEETINEMLSNADEMLYRAKENGRNRVVLINSDGQNIEEAA
ncbi:MAG: GGDEF domain-containing protein [Alphaproteobacteria bacterium]|nr:GGDEF domain-containing protein [Alphaproteobacteria bacterium]